MFKISDLLSNENLSLRFLNNFNDYLLNNQNSICLLLMYFFYASKKINRLHFFLFKCLVMRSIMVDLSYFRKCLKRYWKYTFFFYLKKKCILFIFFEFYFEKVNLLEFSFDYFYDDVNIIYNIIPFKKYHLVLDVLHFLILWVSCAGLRIVKYNQYIIGHYYIFTRKNLRKSLIETLYRRNNVKNTKHQYYISNRAIRFTVVDNFLFALKYRKFRLYWLLKFYNTGIFLNNTPFSINVINSHPLIWLLNITKQFTYLMDENVGIFVLISDIWLNVQALVAMAQLSQHFYSKRNFYPDLTELFKALFVHVKEIMRFVCGYSNMIEQIFIDQLYCDNKNLINFYFLNDLLNFYLAPYINNENLRHQRYCFCAIKCISAGYVNKYFFSINALSIIRHPWSLFIIFYNSIFNRIFIFRLRYPSSHWNMGFLLNRFTLILDYLYWRFTHNHFEYNDYDSNFYDLRLEESILDRKELILTNSFFLKLDVDNILFSRYLEIYFNFTNKIEKENYFLVLKGPEDGLEHYDALDVKLPYWEYLRITDFVFLFLIKDWFLRLFIFSFKMSCIYFFKFKKINLKKLDNLINDFGFYQARVFSQIFLNNNIFRLYFSYYRKLFSEYRYYLNEYRFLKSKGAITIPHFLDFKKKWDLKSVIFLNPLWWNKYVVKNIEYIKYH